MTPPSAAEPAGRSRHVPGLDTIRFLMAFWVLLSHFHVPGWNEDISTPARIVGRLFNGGAAVMVFFVVSGFCIHHPYRESRRVALLPFYARRNVRIIVPALAALLLARITGAGARELFRAILWSLVCEEIYYAIYPALLAARRRVGWDALIVASLIAAYGVPVLVGHRMYMHTDFGPKGDWVISLPIWLLGCRLAESYQAWPSFAPGRVSLWTARGVAWAASLATLWLQKRTPFNYAYTYKVFAFVVAAWLFVEIRTAMRGWRLPLEPLGAFSYSLYLVHWSVLGWCADRFGYPVWSNPASWTSSVCAAIALSVGFYFGVERPSHRAARRIYAWVVAREARPALAAT